MWSKCHILFFVSHVNVHQKASTTEEVLTNQVNEVARLVTISQPLTQPPHNKHKGHMSTMAAMARDAGNVLAHSMNSHLPRQI